MRVLVIEDDVTLQKLLNRGLTSYGHLVEVLGTGEDGLARAKTGNFDALILDLALPDFDGLEVATALRCAGIAAPILMVTARNELSDRLSGFAAGADDYLAKPFAFQELLARLNAITSRAGSPGRVDRLVAGDIVLDRRAHEVTRAGMAIHLAPREYRVLELLMRHAGQVLTRDTIMERVWGHGFEGYSNVVDGSIRRLRAVIDSDRPEPLIQTVRNVGYRMKASRQVTGYSH